MSAAIDTGLAVATPPAKPPLRLTDAQREQPLYVIGAAKKVALKCDWSLRQWVEFRETVSAELDETASAEAFARFMARVGEWFEIG